MRWTLLALVLASCAHAPPPLTVTLADVAGTPAPLFDGRPRALAFVATYCLPCLALLPQVESLAARRPDLSVVAVFFDTEGALVVRPFAQRAHLTIPVLVAGPEVVAGQSPLGRIPELPVVLFLNGAGHPVASVTGLATPEQLDAAAAMALR